MSAPQLRGTPPGLVLRSGVTRFARTPPLRTNPGGEE